MSALTWEERVEIAHRFAPRLILFPEKKELGKPRIEGGAGDYHPRSLELLLERGHLFPGTLRSLGQGQIEWLFNQNSRPPATLDNLAKSDNTSHQIRLLGGPIPNPQQAWNTYFDILDQPDATGRPGRERFPLTTYAHILTREEAERASEANLKISLTDYAGKVGRPFYQPGERTQPDDLALQYWFCYYFDDWANIHEADWESITIFLRRQGHTWQPLGATYSEHENGARRHWADIEHVEETHPVVYVASGSHASYFQYLPEGHNTELSGVIFGGLKFKVGFKINTGNNDFVPEPGAQHPPLTPQVELLPDPIEIVSADNPALLHLRWLSFKGSWGARELGRFIAGGPVGPACKGFKWFHPFAWSEVECWPDYLIY
ncbi:hypothetical protein TFLX_02918 [Thermoflexales bacterium]|nr:hypothetical protein TFLX_02918 [Thermoflexales bacterium]